MRRQAILIGLFIAALYVIVRTILNMPLLKEAFQSGGSATPANLFNSVTECPSGYEMYMYDGIIYCCPGTVNPDSDTVERSCIVSTVLKGEQLCALGPKQPGIPNCNELKAGILAAEGERTCPPSMPNFCKGSQAPNGRCCAGKVTEKGDTCVDQSAGSCDVGTDPNEFKNPNDCRLLRARDMDPPCPGGYGRFFTPVTHGPLEGLTVYGCSNMSSQCYSDAIIKRLGALGYNLGQVPRCSQVTSKSA